MENKKSEDIKIKYDGKLLSVDEMQSIIDDWYKTLKKNEILVHFSSGGQEGLNIFKKVINYFKK